MKGRLFIREDATPDQLQALATALLKWWEACPQICSSLLPPAGAEGAFTDLLNGRLPPTASGQTPEPSAFFSVPDDCGEQVAWDSLRSYLPDGVIKRVDIGEWSRDVN